MGLKNSSPYDEKLIQGGFHSLKRTKCMNTSKCHYGWEGEQVEILLVVFTCFAGFQKWLYVEVSHFDKEGRIKAW